MNFAIINLINAITPNGDGINDVLDYSDLRVKKDVKISILIDLVKSVFQRKTIQLHLEWNRKRKKHYHGNILVCFRMDRA